MRYRFSRAAAPAILGTAILVLTILALATTLAGNTAGAAADWREALFASPDRTGFTLSPDGRSVAFLAPDGDRVGLWRVPVDGSARAAPLPGGPAPGIFQYQWAASGRAIVFQTGPHPGFAEVAAPPDPYALYVVSTAGGKPRQLTPPLDRRVRLFASTRQPDLVFVSPSARLPGARHGLRLDVAADRVHEVAGNDGLTPVYPDMDLEPRLALRPARLGGQDLLLRDDDGRWRVLRSYSFAEFLQFRRVVFEASGRFAYLVHAGPDDRSILARLDLRSGAFSPLAAVPGEDVIDVLADRRSGRPLAWLVDGAPARWVGLDAAVTRDLERVRQALGPGELHIIDQDNDGARWLIRFETDVRPAEIHVFDRASGRLVFRLAESEARSGHTGYRPTRTVAIRARDGLPLSAQLTLPAAPASGGPLPLVLWVHGGPFGVERWTFDPQAQWLAGLGYAVLRVNFRGSTNHGRRFQEAGYGEWGGRMQDDLIDAARWAIAEGIADRRRIAVMGLSYGGFATLDAMADAADIFACGIATAPVADLNLFLDTIADYGDSLTDPVLRAEFAFRLERDRMQIGGDNRTEAGRRHLADSSPLGRVAGIHRPLLIVHGQRDTGVIPAHSERMVAALGERGVDVTYLQYLDEGHGLSRPRNLVSFAAIAENFLAKCLGGSATPLTREDLAGSSLAVPTGAAHVPGLPGVLATGNAVGHDAAARDAEPRDRSPP